MDRRIARIGYRRVGYWSSRDDLDEAFRMIARSERMKIEAEQRAQDRPPLRCAKCRVRDRKPRSPYCERCDWTA